MVHKNIHDGRLPNQVNVLLLEEAVSLSPADIQGMLGEYLPESAAKVTADPESRDSFVIDFGGNVFAVMVIAAPVPQLQLETAIRTSRDQELAEGIVRQQKAHVVISSLTPNETTSHALSTAAKLVHLTAILGSGTPSIGAYWSTGEALIGMDELFDHTAAILEVMPKIHDGDSRASANLPLAFWVGFMLFEDAGKAGIQSQGLRIFTGYEVQISPIQQEHGQLIQWLFALAQYLLGQEITFESGQTLELSPDHTFKLHQVAETKQHPSMMLLELTTT